MKCPKCGNEIANDSQFCEFCGVKLSAGESKTKKKVMWLLFCIVGLCLVGGIIVVAFISSSTGYVSDESYYKDEATYNQLEAEAQAETGASVQTSEYVDLNLPSGTLWKTENEPGWYNYYEASECFGDNLPSMEQLEELKEYCTWSWSGSKLGYDVRGPNGNEIFLPAAGDKDGEQIINKGEFGRYWSSTFKKQGDGTPAAICLSFYSDEVYIYNPMCTMQILVRLTK